MIQDLEEKLKKLVAEREETERKGQDRIKELEKEKKIYRLNQKKNKLFLRLKKNKPNLTK